MFERPFHSSRRRALLFALSVSVSLVAGAATVLNAQEALRSEQLVLSSAESNRASTELHDALRQFHLAATAWLESRGLAARKDELRHKRAQLATALRRSPIADRADALLTEIDDAVADAEPQVHSGNEAPLQDRIDGTLEGTAMALEGAMSRAALAHLQQARALRRTHLRALWISGSFALLALVLTAALGWPLLRSSAKRQGATAMRNELLERTSEGFFALDRGFRFVHLNSVGGRILGLSRRDVVGKTLWEVWPKLSAHPLSHRFRAAMDAPGPSTAEVYWPEVNQWFELRLYPSPEGLSTFFRDVTEERKMRVALAESEARHRQIVQTAQEGIWILDRRGFTSFVNEKLCELLGYAREELLGHHLFDFMDAEGQRIAAENLQRRGLGMREQHDFKLRRKDGTTLWGLLATSALSAGHDDGGTLAMLTDITERRRAEAERGLLLSRERLLRAAAEASNDRYRVLADLVPHVVWTHRADGSVDFVNRTYAERTGQPLDQALGSGWQAMIHPADLPGYREAWKAALLSGEALEHRVRLRTADGSWQWHLDRAQPARDAEGRLVRWFGLAVELEREPRSADAEISEVPRALAS